MLNSQPNFFQVPKKFCPYSMKQLTLDAVVVHHTNINGCTFIQYIIISASYIVRCIIIKLRLGILKFLNPYSHTNIGLQSRTYKISIYRARKNPILIFTAKMETYTLQIRKIHPKYYFVTGFSGTAMHLQTQFRI